MQVGVQGSRSHCHAGGSAGQQASLPCRWECSGSWLVACGWFTGEARLSQPQPPGRCLVLCGCGWHGMVFTSLLSDSNHCFLSCHLTPSRARISFVPPPLSHRVPPLVSQVVGAVGYQNLRLDIPPSVDRTVAAIIQACWHKWVADLTTAAPCCSSLANAVL